MCGGGAGGGRGAEKRFEFTLYLVSLNLLNKGGPMVIANSRFQGAKVQHFPGGGGGPTFSTGRVQFLFPIETYTDCDFQVGGGGCWRSGHRTLVLIGTIFLQKKINSVVKDINHENNT